MSVFLVQVMQIGGDNEYINVEEKSLKSVGSAYGDEVLSVQTYIQYIHIIHTYNTYI